jgi:hypothetical protein
MNQSMQNNLKTIIRNRFGASEIRFYDGSVTVTLVRDFGKFTHGVLHETVFDMLDNVALAYVDQFDIEVVSPNRFKLRVRKDAPHPSERVENTIGLEAEFTDEEVGDVSELRDTIRNVVDEAHDASMLEKLLIKEVESDTEDFIMKNLGSALVILGNTASREVTLDAAKELMRFSYISGLWKNARERDLEVLVKVFNGKFKKYADQWQYSQMDEDEAGHA